MPLLAATVTLWVGVHADAGGVNDIAADGAAGVCAVAPSRIVCPATGPVTFRWGPGGPWALTGDTTLAPGERGVAFVLADDATGGDVERALRAGEVTADDVRTAFAVGAPAPSRGGLDALAEVAVADPRADVRRAAVEALQPYTWRASWGPLPGTAPVPLPEGWLPRVIGDRDRAVRRQAAALAGELRAVADEPLAAALAAEAQAAVVAAMRDPDAKVRAAGLRAASRAVRGDLLPAEAAWRDALARVPAPGAAGRAACGTLARLARSAEPGAVVDPAVAVELTLAHHPELAWRVWAAWRDEVPFRRDWALQLLRTTIGANDALVRHWAEHDRAAFAEVVAAWEPGEPHSERWRVIGTWTGTGE